MNYEDAKYSKGELAKLARRRMVQKSHGDKTKYTRKDKHKSECAMKWIYSN